jgi:hypothetical protein
LGGRGYEPVRKYERVIPGDTPYMSYEDMQIERDLIVETLGEILITGTMERPDQREFDRLVMRIMWLDHTMGRRVEDAVANAAVKNRGYDRT